MLLSHLKTALRSLLRNKGLAGINIVGLAVGIAACLLILLYVADELSYDRHHAHADSVLRVTEQEFDDGGSPGVHRVLIDPPIAPLLKTDLPEVAYAARLTPVGPSLSNGSVHVSSGHCYWTDPDVFDIFTIPLVEGDAATALDAPFSLVLSRTKAKALFGADDPLGKTVLVNNDDPFTVTGVFEDLPANTHLPIDVLGSMATLESWFGTLGWRSPNYATYIRLTEGASAPAVESKLRDFMVRHRGEEIAGRSVLSLQRLTDIHLHSHLVGELDANGDIRYIWLFGGIGLFVLLIACINFMNLSTARATRRAKEVGMRKAIGAGRADLIGQFLGESIVLTFVSLAFAVGIAALVLPSFNDFTGKSLTLVGHGLALKVAALLAIGLIVGVAAGSYPAFYLSSFRPVAVLKGSLPGGQGGAGLRAALVVTQFVIAIVLIVSTVAVYRQLGFIQKQNLGFDKEEVLILPSISEIRTDFEPFRERLLSNPNVIDVSQSNPIPGRRLSFSVDASSTAGGSVRDATLYPVFADQHFFPAYDIKMLAGRNFSDEYASDETTGFVLNRTAAEAMGWREPSQAVGAPMRVGGWQGSVIGVVDDFHLESLHQRIAPMVFYMDQRNYRLVSLRMRPGTDLPNLIAFLDNEWRRYQPDTPLEYEFLDSRLGAVYEAERRLGLLVAIFASLAIFVTCLGLLGMAAFAVERRTKEIGVRKALGASAASIVLLFTREFTRLVALAFVIASVIAFFALRRWLESWAYHASLSWWIFGVAGLVALAITLVTVSYQAGRAATVNPVKSLRYE